MKDIVKGWNAFVDAMIYARDLWEKHQQRMLSTPRSELENQLTREARKVLASTTHRAKFDIALPRLVDIWRTTGGLENLIVPVPKGTMVKNKKEKPDGKQQQLDPE
jgi:hypothetical protein